MIKLQWNTRNSKDPQEDVYGDREFDTVYARWIQLDDRKDCSEVKMILVTESDEVVVYGD